MSQKDVEVYNLLLERYVSGINVRLRRIYNFSEKRIGLFWRDVWEEFADSNKEEDIKLDQLVQAKLKSITKRGKKKHEVLSD